MIDSCQDYIISAHCHGLNQSLYDVVLIHKKCDLNL